MPRDAGQRRSLNGDRESINGSTLRGDLMPRIIYFPTIPKGEYRERFKQAYRKGGFELVGKFVEEQIKAYIKGKRYGGYRP